MASVSLLPDRSQFVVRRHTERGLEPFEENSVPISSPTLTDLLPRPERWPERDLEPFENRLTLDVAWDPWTRPGTIWNLVA